MNCRSVEYSGSIVVKKKYSHWSAMWCLGHLSQNTKLKDQIKKGSNLIRNHVGVIQWLRLTRRHVWSKKSYLLTQVYGVREPAQSADIRHTVIALPFTNTDTCHTLLQQNTSDQKAGARTKKQFFLWITLCPWHGIRHGRWRPWSLCTQNSSFFFCFNVCVRAFYVV